MFNNAALLLVHEFDLTKIYGPTLCFVAGGDVSGLHFPIYDETLDLSSSYTVFINGKKANVNVNNLSYSEGDVVEIAKTNPNAFWGDLLGTALISDSYEGAQCDVQLYRLKAREVLKPLPTIADGEKYIGLMTIFKDSEFLQAVCEKLFINNSLTNNAAGAFQNCTLMTSFPSDILDYFTQCLSIPRFFSRTGLTSFYFDASEHPTYWCQNIKQLFMSCQNLETVVFKNYTNGPIYDTRSIFTYCPKLKTVDLTGNTQLYSLVAFITDGELWRSYNNSTDNPPKSWNPSPLLTSIDLRGSNNVPNVKKEEHVFNDIHGGTYKQYFGYDYWTLRYLKSTCNVYCTAGSSTAACLKTARAENSWSAECNIVET